MTNQDRNIRTLITCFIIALVALVPLRIVELNNSLPQDAMVLGDETEVYEGEFIEEEYVEEEVIEEEIFEEDMVLGEETEMIEEEVVEEEIIEEEIELPNAELE